MKQINLYSPIWKEGLKYLGWLLLFVVLWFRGCSSPDIKPQIVKVTVPEVRGSFESKKPVHELVSSKIERTATGKEILQVQNPINQKLIAENEKLKSDFAKATDSIKKISFEKAIELNKFSSKFEDENLILSIEGVVRGEVQEVTPAYIIKEKIIKVPVKQKETVFRVLGGGAVGLDQATAKIAYRADLGLQNKKGDIVSIEFLKIGSQNYGMVGFKKSIFSIKR